jgi:uncharacterized protein YggU (UPF0235/DUF167 family)
MKEEKLVQVKVFAEAKKEKVEMDEGILRIFVREPAQKNMANFRVRELVAMYFEVPLTQVQILTGHRSPKKRLSVTIKVK